MKCTNIEVRVGATVNLGNFESLRLDYGMDVELEEGDGITESYDKARKLIVDKIKKDLLESEGGKKFIK